MEITKRAISKKIIENCFPALTWPQHDSEIHAVDGIVHLPLAPKPLLWLLLFPTTFALPPLTKKRPTSTIWSSLSYTDTVASLPMLSNTMDKAADWNGCKYVKFVKIPSTPGSTGWTFHPSHVPTEGSRANLRTGRKNSSLYCRAHFRSHNQNAGIKWSKLPWIPHRFA